MATVTGGGVTTFINVGSNDANGSAQALANTITTGLANGTLTRTTGSNPATGAGVLTVTTPGSLIGAQFAVKDILISGSANAAPTGASVSVVGAGGPMQAVIGDNENITYYTRGGGGSFVFGDGNDLFGTPTQDGGNNMVTMGGGTDTVNIYSGKGTVSTGSGSTTVNTGLPGTLSSNLIFIGSGPVSVISTGGFGTDTVIGGNGAVTISEATKSLVFNGAGGSGGATISGGSGSDTVFLGPGGGSVGGGTAGNNILVGGTGSAPTTLFGGGNGDQLFAKGSGVTFMIAGPGNETLQGGGSTGNNIYAAGNGGNTTIGGGAGNEVYYVGNPGTSTPTVGSATIDFGTGADIVSFTNRGSGNAETAMLNSFNTSLDKIQLIGFSQTSTQQAITTAAASAGSVTLSDGTKITFGSAVNLNSSNFA